MVFHSSILDFAVEERIGELLPLERIWKFKDDLLGLVSYMIMNFRSGPFRRKDI